MKLTKKLFKEKVKFTVAEDKYFTFIENKHFLYQYDFCYLHKVHFDAEKIIKDYIEGSYLCEIYQTYFKVYYTFFGVDLSKKIYYENCTVVEN